AGGGGRSVRPHLRRGYGAAPVDGSWRPARPMMIEKGEEGRSRLREAPLTTDNGQPATGPTALLLIAHGSRQEEANADLYQLAEALRTRGRYGVVEAAFLELAEPTVAQGAARAVGQGAGRGWPGGGPPAPGGSGAAGTGPGGGPSGRTSPGGSSSAWPSRWGRTRCCWRSSPSAPARPTRAEPPRTKLWGQVSNLPKAG